MKIQNYNYHSHTTFSDGKYSLEDMLQRAVDLGLDTIGITDHLIIHKCVRQSRDAKDCPFQSSRITHAYSLEESKKVLENQVNYIRETAKKYPIKVLVSFETDFFDYPEWQDEIKYLTQDLNLDYLLTGNHFAIHENKMFLLSRLGKYIEDKETQDKLFSEHFNLIAKAIRSKMFDFVAHIDWVRSGGLCGEEDFKEERLDIIKALEETNTAYEISTKGYRKIGSHYPARWMIDELCKRNVPVVISDDAHRTSEITQDFDKIEKILEELNYINRFKL